MLIFHNPSHRQHDGRQEMFRGRLVPCHETPARMDYILAELQSRRWGELRVPGDAGLALIPIHGAVAGRACQRHGDALALGARNGTGCMDSAGGARSGGLPGCGFYRPDLQFVASRSRVASRTLR